MAKAGKKNTPDLVSELRDLRIQLMILGGTKSALIRAPSPYRRAVPEPQLPTNREAAVSDTQPRPRSRKRRGQGAGPQRLRAHRVLRRLWPQEYPTREEVSNQDLFDRFAKEYEQVESKANLPSKHGMPSLETVLREVGRKD
jgi:hypothetical protein